MKKNKKKDINIDWLITSLPFFFGIIMLYVNWKFKFISQKLPGIDSILDSIINYTSIIIGVLVALFGIIVTITESDVMKKLKGVNGDKIVFKYSLETLLSNFIVLILSIVLQSLTKFEPTLKMTDTILIIWFFCLIYATVSSIKTIFYLLLISFYQDDKSKKPSSTSKMTKEKELEIQQKHTFSESD
ncbi:hypothetical protein [Vagococcus lutrae]|uniref:hypothetical protein n=1 Tax=Vagococcus lutrae TaxID=81947 RepID=UPI002A80432F|nr:hypothetical protein [Vagococcus lutrae]MDY3705191.1 hypothetical protein [Vagococcus lutrae]